MHFLYETPRAIFHRTNSRRRNDDRPVLRALSRECIWVVQTVPSCSLALRALQSRKLCGHFIVTNPTEWGTGSPCFQSLTHHSSSSGDAGILKLQREVEGLLRTRCATIQIYLQAAGWRAKAFPGPLQQLVFPAPAQPKRGDKGKGKKGKGISKNKDKDKDVFAPHTQPRPRTCTFRKFQVMAQLGHGFNSCLLSPAQSRGGKGVCLKFQSSLPCTNTPCTHDNSCAGCGKNDIPYDFCGCFDHAAFTWHPALFQRRPADTSDSDRCCSCQVCRTTHSSTSGSDVVGSSSSVYRMLHMSMAVSDGTEVLDSWDKAQGSTVGQGCKLLYFSLTASVETLVVLQVLDMVRNGYYDALHNVPLAATWSRTRHMDNRGQQPVRSRRHLLHLPKVSSEAEPSVKTSWYYTRTMVSHTQLIAPWFVWTRISDVELRQTISEASTPARIVRPMCDGRPFVSSPFRRLASRGICFFFAAFLCGGTYKLLSNWGAAVIQKFLPKQRWRLKKEAEPSKSPRYKFYVIS